ncbi:MULTISPECIES: CHRD domain-containing protein [Actinosynnema]|uniref:CHRD domain-containing protein n=1 Tax=Actinosynnema TaxID=40566 RepID=UPI0020A3AC9C|nr:CHRD domain-containing protein [Actinosynnema pretiosum]MCP2092525.1 CHRD domain-containing protein [Actinosynnema pretiosum]
MAPTRRLTAPAALALALTALAPLGAAQADAGWAHRRADLAGADVVPGPGDEDGDGSAKLRLRDDSAEGELCATVSLRRVLPPTDVQLRRGSAGQNGPLLLSLEPPRGESLFTRCFTVDVDLVREIEDFPERFHITALDEDFPGGALRGQLRSGV